MLSCLLLQTHAEHNVNSQVTPSLTNTVLNWIIGIKSIFYGVRQTTPQDTGVPGTSNVGEHSSELYILYDPLAAQFIFRSIKSQRLPINHQTPKHKQTAFWTLKLLVEFPMEIQRESLTIPFTSHGFHRYPIHCSTLTHKSL